MAWTLKAGRELSTYGGYGVDRKLRTMRDDAAVVWVRSNSYVCVRRDDGTFRVESINGIGEIRWTLDPAQVGWSGDGGAREAIAYFLEEVVVPGEIPDGVCCTSMEADGTCREHGHARKGVK